MSPAPLEIREIAPDEFHLVWPIFHGVVEAGDSFALDPSTTFEEGRRMWATPPTRAFVAMREGKVVGTYMLRPVQPGLGDHVANAGYIVAPEARGQGLARLLCEDSIRRAREAGYRAMQFSYVVASNEPAIRTWQRCGFTVVGTVPAAFRHRTLGLVDVLIMHRFLHESSRAP